MILVADSGSTKCDWLPINENTIFDHPEEKPLKFSTMGFNPFFHSSELIGEKIKDNQQLVEIAAEISEIYYYGAACSSHERKKIIADGIKMVFPAAKIIVDHDLAGAVYATCGNEAGICCILGTGSNSCKIDQKGRITEVVPALSYVLGDEGSGAYFGKLFLRHFLYHELPTEIENDFRENFGIDKEQIFENVYKRSHANVYLASFMRFISTFKTHPFVHQMMMRGFGEFLDIHVLKFPDARSLNINFVGSVAFHFQGILKEACQERQLELGKVIKQPIYELGKYHAKK